MRVWIVNQYAISPGQAGGTRHYSLARELVQRGHEVTIIASSFDHASRTETRLAEHEVYKMETVEGVTFLWLRTPPYPGNTLARLWNMTVFAWRVYAEQGVAGLLRPDVVIGSSPHPFGALAAQRLSVRLKVPFVLEVRDLWPQSLIELGNVSEKHPLVWGLLAIERHLYRQADHICTLLEGSVEHIVQKGAVRDKISWIPNGVDLTLAPDVTPLPDNPVFTVMYAGAHGLANVLAPVIDAAAILQREGYGDRVRFRFVGDGPAKSGLQHRAVSEGIRNVCFEPSVPKNELFRTLQEADAFWVGLKDSPLYRWGISQNKMFDYLASARPIIFSGNSPYNQVLAARAGLTLPPEDGKAIADAVKQLLATPATERAEMGISGRRYVETHYSNSGLAARLEEVLLNVTARRGE